MRMIIVEWTDSSFHTEGWQDLEVISGIGLAECISVGVVYYEDEKKLCLVPNINRETGVQSIIIPKVAIKRIRQLKVSND